jgi:chemotaxis protein methyltransferase CheR
MLASRMEIGMRPGHEFDYSIEDFSRVRYLIESLAGISLHERKESMVYNRLSRRLRATGLRSFREYLDQVEAPGSGERESFVNALTTNLTAFFREPHHFTKLAALQASRPGAALKVWSSACSTGEEPYSAAMALREAGRDAAILATDIDTEALASAREGIYKLEAVERLGVERMRSHFLRGTGEYASRARVRPELREMTTFARRNLLAEDWPAGERFDAVFCRNVMIYFDRGTQRRLLDRFAAVLRPGGLLFVGHSESCASGHPDFRPCGNTSYERRDASVGPAAAVHG